MAKRGAQPGNLNALKHGFYSRIFKKVEIEHLELFDEVNLRDEIILMRIIINRIFNMSQDIDSPETLSNLLNSLGMAAIRMASLMKTEKILNEGDNFNKMLVIALNDVAKEMMQKRNIEVNRTSVL